ncbi:MAG: hypothetical protein FJW30_22080 [Acidobacteria bacterium]|nr:hypothetical protein [Acidobacteriota bacterium]
MRITLGWIFAAACAAQPVVLINGYQGNCNGATAEGTFGQMPQRLRDLGREVVFFNNCSVPAGALPRPTIEEMGAALGVRIAAIPAPQVDVVVHSMGGLILRAYLSGKQIAPATFRPPANHKVRRAVFLGTPHFGPGFAGLLSLVAASDPQVRQLLPGSPFLHDLGTWNQGGDDLRGVDALAVIGNSATVDSVPSGGDGLVPVPSAALSFTGAGLERTRLVPMCHTGEAALALISSSCARPPFLANVDSEMHLSWRIIRSFLTGTEEWRTLGETIGSTVQGGLLMSVRDKDDARARDVTRVTLGPVTLQRGAEHHYALFAATGRQPVAVTTGGGTTTTEMTIASGLFSVGVVKPGPMAVAALPAAGRVPLRVLAPGMFVSVYGGALAAGSAAASALPLPTTLSGTQLSIGTAALGLQFAGPSQVNAILPETAAGLVTLELKTAAGTSKLNVMVEPSAPAIFTQTGTGSGPASALHALTGELVTVSAPVHAGDVVSLYLTGLGATETRDGLEWARLTPTVRMGAMEATVLYAGRAPGFAGLDQINFQVPSGAGAELVVESGGRPSNTATLPVR